jgi:branched-chain amino acid transport system ATP-binding protein
MLSVRDLTIRFGGIVALDKVSFAIGSGQILGLIGPNGAGKTTLFNCVSRLYTPTSGDILFNGASLLGQPAHRIAQLGVNRTFQNLALFRSMSVLDNVRVGAHARSSGDFFTDALRLGRARQQQRKIDTRAAALLADLGLESVAYRCVADLPTGTQKRVELARALAGEPKLLLLDEPAGGLNHRDVEELGRTITGIRDRHGVTVLLVEHHMNLVMSVSDTVVALDFGRKIAEGTPDEVRNDAEVVRAYLGGAAA